MKLRNKKTGEIIESECITMFGPSYGSGACRSIKEFYTLAELNENWEDYAPQEPLITDEKIRKAVRAWADANDIDSSFYHDKRIKFNLSEHRFTWIDTSIEFYDIIGLENLKNHKSYTITELCGDEE